jgi:hypothetical protein
MMMPPAKVTQMVAAQINRIFQPEVQGMNLAEKVVRKHILLE